MIDHVPTTLYGTNVLILAYQEDFSLEACDLQLATAGYVQVTGGKQQDTSEEKAGDA